MNHLLRRQRLKMAALALLCLGLLSRPQAAAQGFADGARLCVGSLLPALFPFMVVCELLVGMALPKALLRPQARLLGLQSEDTAAALLASWLGGYAVCARLTAQLRAAGRISARDAALLMMLGCCSGPGFVVGYIGGLLLGSTSLGALLYAGQLAANLLAAGLCLPMLPKADAHGVREVPCKKEKQEISLPTAISSAASTCLDLCGCVIFFRVAAGVLLSVAPLPDSAAACISAACEITAGCAAFAALGGKAALYGICLAMSLLGFSVWGELPAVAARPGADADACHKPPAACRPLSPAGAAAALGAAAGADRVQHAGPAGRTNVPPAAGCRCGGGGVSLHTALQRLQKHL